MTLPPNMRKPEDCPRERHPLQIVVLMDDQILYQAALPPTGFRADGKSTAYQRIRASAGAHNFAIRMNDSGTTGSFNFESLSTINLLPGENLVVYFDADGQQFRFH